MDLMVFLDFLLETQQSDPMMTYLAPARVAALLRSQLVGGKGEKKGNNVPIKISRLR